MSSRARQAELDAVAAALGALARRRVPLGPMTTYRVGGPAEILVEVRTPGELRLLSQALAGTEVEVLVVGRGSNLLVADTGFAGVAVTLGGEFARIDLEQTRVTAGAAASLPVVARRTAAAGLSGLEWAVGVPGSLGGAVRMNAGGHGSEMSKVLRSIRVVELGRGEDVVVPAEALDLGYRTSNIGARQVVLEAELELEPGDPVTSERLISEVVRWRRENQPGGQNAGSVFRNPPGDHAARLVEQVGAKGLRIGTARIAEKHANFILVDEGGLAGDVIALMSEVQRLVLDRCGVVLVPETQIVGSAAGAEEAGG